MIETRELKKSFKSEKSIAEAVRGINLNVEQGEIVPAGDGVEISVVILRRQEKENRRLARRSSPNT